MIGQAHGHYRILEKFAAGGMGVVYLARDEQLERDVAVKVLPSGTFTDEATRRHFRKEAAALAKLNHPPIEKVYDLGHTMGSTFSLWSTSPEKLSPTGFQAKRSLKRKSLNSQCRSPLVWRKRTTVASCTAI